MQYLKLLEKNQISPNFWCSDEYIEKAGLIQEGTDNAIWMYEEDDLLTAVLPPIPIEKTRNTLTIPIILRNIWSDTPEATNFRNTTKEFLDYEFIYDPLDFLTMKGKNWAVFRKNTKKFPSRYPNNFCYVSIEETETILGRDKLGKKVEELLLAWLEFRPHTDIHDGEVLVRYVRKGKNRRFLIDMVEKKLLGMNVWDENYKYINFRYNICRPIKYLDEYLRHRFYTSTPVIWARHHAKKLVNDGGSLGNPQLEKFKRKLNPVVVRNVYSWKTK